MITPLTESHQKGNFTFDLIAYTSKLRMDVVLWDMHPAWKVTRDLQELLQQVQYQLQQTRKQLRHPEEELEDKRMQRWEKRKNSADGEHAVTHKIDLKSLDV